jgi:hypothetical protein
VGGSEGRNDGTLTSSLGASGMSRPKASRISDCRSQKSLSRLLSSAWFCVTEMLTIEPADAPGGSSTDGNSIRWARSPSRI